MKKNAKKGLRKGRGSRNTLKIEDIEAVFAERKPGAEGNFKFFSVLVPVYLFAIEIPPMSIKINFALRRPYILKYSSFFEKNKRF